MSVIEGATVSDYYEAVAAHSLIPPKLHYANVLPEELQQLLLKETTAPSIENISASVYRSTNRYQFLGISAGVAVKSGNPESVRHVTVVFVMSYEEGFLKNAKLFFWKWPLSRILDEKESVLTDMLDSEALLNSAK